MSIIIRQYEPCMLPDFSRMLARYYREEAGIPLPESAEEEFAVQLSSETSDSCRLWLAFCNSPSSDGEEPTGTASNRLYPAGFIFAQIDSADSLWDYRPGDGFVRELSVEPGFRGRGVGRALWLTAEAYLRRTGTSLVYLTAEEPAAGFWRRMGFSPTGEICRRNRLPMYEKSLTVLPGTDES